MSLSADLIDQFVKITNDKPPISQESTVYGEAVIHDGVTYVKMDGSELLTPVITTTEVNDGERVTVLIKNHSAVVTGNMSNPSASTLTAQSLQNNLTEINNKILEFDIAIGDRVIVDELNAEIARIDTLTTDNVNIRKTLTAAAADIETLKSKDISVDGTISAVAAIVEELQTSKLNVDQATVTFATIDNLITTNAEINALKTVYSEFYEVVTQELSATNAEVERLDAKKLSVEDAKITYANIDFSNIGQAAMEHFYANSGLIENVTISDGTITGLLVGVTIKGDIIEANTLVADSLVMLGEDGLYYKLNTNGVTVGSEQTEYNSINGSIITAKSITATQISVDDLVAFDATIGGFNITEHAIFSEVKDDEGNMTRGVYLGDDGQVNFGDDKNYIKYYRDDDDNYKLVISAETILYDINGDQHSLADIGAVGEYVKIGAYEGEPSIELGEVDSDFKMVITNTKILFMEGTNVPAYVSNQSLFIKKAVIEEELQQGGFVWKARTNGNLGLMWKGASG